MQMNVGTSRRNNLPRSPFKSDPADCVSNCTLRGEKNRTLDGFILANSRFAHIWLSAHSSLLRGKFIIAKWPLLHLCHEPTTRGRCACFDCEHAEEK